MDIYRYFVISSGFTVLPLDLKGVRTVLTLLLLLGLLVSSESNTQQRRIQGGVGRDTTFYCNSGQCTWYYGGPTGSASINPETLSDVSYVYDTLTIEDVVADHEGVYRCEYNGGQDIFNLTVVAVPTFIGCTPQSHCNPNTTLNFSEGLDITLNISIQYVNGGARGVKQGIQYMKFKKSSDDDSLIRCEQSSCTGNSRVGSSYSRDSWNLTFNVSNVTVYDTGTYYAEAGLIDPNDPVTLSKTTSTLTINVTSTIGVVSTNELVSTISTIITSTSSTTVSPTSFPSSTVTPSTSSKATPTTSGQANTLYNLSSGTASIASTSTSNVMLSVSPPYDNIENSNDLNIHAYILIGLTIFIIILIYGGLCMACFLRKRGSSKPIQAINYSTSSLDSTSDKSIPTSVTVMPYSSSSLQIFDIIKHNSNLNLSSHHNSTVANV